MFQHDFTTFNINLMPLLTEIIKTHLKNRNENHHFQLKCDANILKSNPKSPKQHQNRNILTTIYSFENSFKHNFQQIEMKIESQIINKSQKSNAIL